MVHVEVSPGVVVVLAAWMLDAAACAGMEIGPPRAAVSALVVHHRLLVDLGLRSSSPDDSNVVREERDGQAGCSPGGQVERGERDRQAAEHCVRSGAASRDLVARSVSVA